MRETRKPGNYPCQLIVYTLKFQDVIKSNILIKGIAIVNSTATKSRYTSFGKMQNTYTPEYNEGHEYDKSSNDKFVKYAV